MTKQSEDEQCREVRYGSVGHGLHRSSRLFRPSEDLFCGFPTGIFRGKFWWSFNYRMSWKNIEKFLKRPIQIVLFIFICIINVNLTNNDVLRCCSKNAFQMQKSRQLRSTTQTLPTMQYYNFQASLQYLIRILAVFCFQFRFLPEEQ